MRVASRPNVSASSLADDLLGHGQPIFYGTFRRRDGALAASVPGKRSHRRARLVGAHVPWVNPESPKVLIIGRNGIGDAPKLANISHGARSSQSSSILVGNRTYPTIVADYERSFAKLSRMKADIVLTSHPDTDIADVLRRRARGEAGDRSAFIDPKELQEIISLSKRNFETALADARRGHSGD